MGRIGRKLFATLAQWKTGSGSSVTTHTILLGAYTTDSSVEYNHEIEDYNDVLGINHSDVEKTAPVQTFDPHFVMKNADSDTIDAFDEYMVKAAMKNDIEAYNGAFDVYNVALFLDSGTNDTHVYYTVKHANSTITADSLGGESHVTMPITVRYSNDITEGTCSTIVADTFTFTPAA